MQLLAPDILMEARGFSADISAGGLALGFLLWISGWHWRRFWIVLTATVSAGILGIATAPLHGLRPLLGGVLAGLAAGVLALALAQVVLFVAAGLAACIVVRLTLPPDWNAPLGWFLAGGTAGLFLSRFWTMIGTSFAGTVVMGYSLLCLLDRLGRLDAIALAEQQGMLLNNVCWSVALAGFILQWLLDRRRLRKRLSHEDQAQQLAEKENQMYTERRRWLIWGKKYRQAG